MEASHPIDRGLEILRAFVAERPELERERLGSQAEFFQIGSRETEGAGQLHALGRHFEWFLFERHSPTLGDLPIFALESEPDVRLEALGEGVWGSLRQSRAGLFRVTSLEPGQGLWLEDLASRGALPVAEAEASHGLVLGDLLVGRLYPLGDEQYRLSPSMAVFRDERLAEALDTDLEAARSARRGTLRIAQQELERMFFGAVRFAIPGAAIAAPADAVPLPSTAELAHDLRTFLVSDPGLPAELADPLIERLVQRARGANRLLVAGAMEDLLDQVAFHSSLDLERARRLTLLYWNALCAEAFGAGDAGITGQSAAPTIPSAVKGNPSQPRAKGNRGADMGLAAFKRFARANRDQSSSNRDSNDRVDLTAAQRALSAFDEGRARGDDLEALFGQLERDLGLEGELEDDPGLLPDLTGVIPALVEEYLWERRQEGLEAIANSDAPWLKVLAEECQELGLCEELDAERVAKLAASWMLDISGPALPGGDPLPSIERFSRWIEEQHGHPLWTDLERRGAGLLQDLPRLAEVQRELERAGQAQTRSDLQPSDAELVQTSLEHGDTLGIRDPEGRFVDLVLEPAIRSALRPGDRVHVRWQGGRPRLVGIEPPGIG